MTTDKATPPMATAVAPKSHFQLTTCGQYTRNVRLSVDTWNKSISDPQLILHQLVLIPASVCWHEQVKHLERMVSPMKTWPGVSACRCCRWLGCLASSCTWPALRLSAPSASSPAWRVLHGWSTPGDRKCENTLRRTTPHSRVYHTHSLITLSQWLVHHNRQVFW